MVEETAALYSRIDLMAAKQAGDGLVAAGISLAVIGIGGAIEGSGHGEGADTLGNVLMYGGLGGLWLGGPIVHTAHGHWGLGLASLALRVALPVAGAAIGGAAADCTKDEWLCGLGEAVLGYTIGTAAAITIDAAVLARWSAFGRSDTSSAAITPPSRPRAVALAPRPRDSIGPNLIRASTWLGRR